MERKEKQEKKAYIGGHIDLSGGRFKDSEVDALYDLVENRNEYNGTSKTYHHSFTDRSSEGKYTRDEETTYTFRADDRGVRIEEHYEYHDDDGQTGSSDWEYSTGREILRNMGKVFRP